MSEVKQAAGIMLAITESIAVNKANAQAAANELRARCVDGRLNHLEVYQRLAFLTEVALAFADDTTRAAIVERIKEEGAGTGKVIAPGGLFRAQATGTKYDYTGDQPWQDLNQTILALTDKRKAREEFLKALPGMVLEEYKPLLPIGATLDEHAQHDAMGTEAVEVRPPNVTSKEGFTFTMNKE